MNWFIPLSGIVNNQYQVLKIKDIKLGFFLKNGTRYGAFNPLFFSVQFWRTEMRQGSSRFSFFHSPLSTLGLLSEEDVKHYTSPGQLSHSVFRGIFWNNNGAENLVITSLHTVPGALLTLGNVPGFPSTAQNKTTENTLFIVWCQQVQLEEAAVGGPSDSSVNVLYSFFISFYSICPSPVLCFVYIWMDSIIHFYFFFIMFIPRCSSL